MSIDHEYNSRSIVSKVAACYKNILSPGLNSLVDKDFASDGSSLVFSSA